MSKDILQLMKYEAKKAIASGEVGVMIGWGPTRFEDKTRPIFARSEEDCDSFVWNKYCVNNLGKYTIDDRYPAQKIGLFVRGCDSRAINRLIKDKALKRENVYLIGVPCDGKDNPICEGCQHKNPLVYDVMVGEAVEEKINPERFAEVAEFAKLSPDERYDFWAKQYDKCIHCYACRNACPACNCVECYADQYRVGWQKKQASRAENQVYGLTRAYHVGDRCIECGECERVCPMSLPIMRQTKKMLADINAIYGDYECGLTDDQENILGQFDLNDLDEFM